jgi:asparagine synthase (glutamine-hydrolysing)
MCGFTGFMSLVREIDTQSLFDMTDDIDHRGPDDEGFGLFSLSNQLYKTVDRSETSKDNSFHGGVGFKRLSIRDLSAAGHQPMLSDDKNVIMVFNGEIYNAKEISDRLVKAGSVFKGHSDTEVLLNLYIKHGLDYFLKEIDGMYSIAIIDLKLKRLSLIRDHMGIKPLYYYSNMSDILFSSEAKSFYKYPFFEKVFNEEKLDEFLYYRCLSDNATMLKHVNQVPPGFVLNVDENGKVEKYRYYSLPQWSTKKLSDTASFNESIKSSVLSQLTSDAPLGCQLSGGVDSSVICKFANANKVDLMSFSVIFDDKKYSEESYIDIATSTIGLDNLKFTISEDFFIDNLEKSAWHLDDPIHHPNSLGIYYLTQQASKHVKVLLSGEGADEMFGGYSRFLYANLPFKPIMKLLRLCNKFIKIPVLNNIGYTFNDVENYVLMSTAGDVRDTAKLFPSSNIKKVLADRTSIFNNEGNKSFLQKCIAYELKTYLPSLLLRQDKMAMANSLENRVPFLGRKFIEEARLNLNASHCVSMPFGMPSRFNVMKGTKKPLKMLSESIFGEGFTYRPKQGFGFPLVSLLMNKILSEKFKLAYKPSLLNHTKIEEKTIDNVWGNREVYPEQAFTLLSLGVWVNVTFDTTLI